MNNSFYITTPIYYPSGKPHLGHAYTTLVADALARFNRLDNKDVLFATGTDEHGLKLQRKAEEENITPLEYVSKMREQFLTLSPLMNFSNDDFISTTEERHIKAAQEMWKRLEANGYIYKDTYAGWYCVSDEAYFTEEELVDGKSPDSGNPVEWMEEESYFFKLSAFTDTLLEFYEANPDFIQPANRKAEIINFVKQGLQDFSISRTKFNWGVPVPGDEKHVMYVWIDALTNYLTVAGFPDKDISQFWPADIHLVGKDIAKFHCIYWPAMLIAAKIDTPKTVFVHGHWLADGKKMSKSLGNVIDPYEIVEKFGQDQFRFYLLSEITFGADGSFSKEGFIAKSNSYLANDIGNLFQRVLSFAHKNFEGKIPALGELTEEDKAFLANFEGLADRVRTNMQAYKINGAIDEIWTCVRLANKYMEEQHPWTYKKEDPAKCGHILRVLMESFKFLACLTQPFIPTGAEKLAKQLGYENLAIEDLNELISLETGKEFDKPEGVFMRIQNEEA